MARTPAPAMSTEQARTRSAATAIMALGSPAGTRSHVAAKKAKARRPMEPIMSLPHPFPCRVTGYWGKNKIEKRSTPLVEVLDQTMPVPHPDLAPYWGNVDDPSSIYLFDRPAAKYAPIKLPKSVEFTDTIMVSFYLMKCIVYFIK